MFSIAGTSSALHSLSHDLATNGVAVIVGSTGDVETGGQVGNGELRVASVEVGDIALDKLSVAIQDVNTCILSIIAGEQQHVSNAAQAQAIG